MVAIHSHPQSISFQAAPHRGVGRAVRFGASATTADTVELSTESATNTHAGPKTTWWQRLKANAGQVADWLLNTLLFDPLISLYQAWYVRPKVRYSVSQAGDWVSWNNYGHLNEKELERFSPIRFEKRDGNFKVPPLTKDGPTLQAYWLPALDGQGRLDEGARKTVVMGHGYGWSYQGMLATAQAMRKQGFNIMLFDFRNHNRSTGSRTTFGFDEAEDVAAVINFVKENHANQSQTLLYMGHSMGAAAAMLAGEKLKDTPELLNRLNSQVDGLILDSPYQSLNRFISDHVIRVTRHSPGFTVLKWIWPKALLEKFEKRILESLGDEDKWYPALGQVPNQLQTDKLFLKSPLSQKPILLIHGTQDGVTNFKHAETIFNTLRSNGKQVTLLGLQGEDHTGYHWQPLENGKNYQTVHRYSSRAWDVLSTFAQNPNTRFDEAEIIAPQDRPETPKAKAA